MILNRPELANITAVKDGKVYCFSTDISTGLSYWIGILYMAKILHPDIFSDLDPVAIHQEYLTRFQKLDFDLDQHGVFFYPAEAM
jgi:iron complex transport system substrate-binding protein